MDLGSSSKHQIVLLSIEAKHSMLCLKSTSDFICSDTVAYQLAELESWVVDRPGCEW